MVKRRSSARTGGDCASLGHEDEAGHLGPMNVLERGFCEAGIDVEGLDSAGAVGQEDDGAGGDPEDGALDGVCLDLAGARVVIEGVEVDALVAAAEGDLVSLRQKGGGQDLEHGVVAGDDGLGEVVDQPHVGGEEGGRSGSAL